MTAFTLIPNGWFDPFELVASLRPRMGWIRDGDAPRSLRVTPKVIEKWVELGNMLEMMEAFGEGKYERRDAHVEMVAAGMTCLMRSTDLLMTLRTNPSVSLHAPTQFVNPEPGYLVVVADVPVCVMNMGQSPWVGLLIEARRTPSP